MIPQRIQRQRTKGWRKPEGAVYVGRGTRWGNPFIVGNDFSIQEHFGWGAQRVLSLRGIHRADAVTLYRLWVINHFAGDADHPSSAEARIELAGKNLMCWCPLNQPCHADVLLELANGDRLPAGTPVLFWPGARVGEGRPSVTRTPIWKMGDGTEVVSVEGYPGGIALTHIQTLPEGETTTGPGQTPSTTPEARS